MFKKTDDLVQKGVPKSYGCQGNAKLVLISKVVILHQRRERETRLAKILSPFSISLNYFYLQVLTHPSLRSKTKEWRVRKGWNKDVAAVMLSGAAVLSPPAAAAAAAPPPDPTPLPRVIRLPVQATHSSAQPSNINHWALSIKH